MVLCDGSFRNFSRREMAEHENAESHTVTDAIRLDVRTSS